MEFTSKTAVITGASSGIGRSMATALAGQGVDIVIAARNEKELAVTAQSVEKTGRRVLAISCDVTRDADVANLAVQSLKFLGKIDILINNAGVAVRGLVENMTVLDWEFIVNTNLMGYIRNIQAFLPHMLARGSGYIVNISSIQAIATTGDSLNIPYITTKAAICGLSEALYSYLKPKGISVTCAAPGAISTGMGVNAHFVGTEKEIAEMKVKEEKFFKMPFFMPPDRMADILVKAMQQEQFLVIIPEEMSRRLPAMGRDADKLNDFMKGNFLAGQGGKSS